MSKIDITIDNSPVTFTYSITKSSEENKEDRFWNFRVTHENDNIVHISKSFFFGYDTRDNIMTNQIDTPLEIIAEKIIEQEGL